MKYFLSKLVFLLFSRTNNKILVIRKMGWAGSFVTTQFLKRKTGDTKGNLQVWSIETIHLLSYTPAPQILKSNTKLFRLHDSDNVFIFRHVVFAAVLQLNWSSQTDRTMSIKQMSAFGLIYHTTGGLIHLSFDKFRRRALVSFRRRR